MLISEQAWRMLTFPTCCKNKNKLCRFIIETDCNAYPIENSALPALRLSTAFCTCQSQTSLTLLSHHEPQTFPSRLSTWHMPRSRARPSTTMVEADSGVTARMLLVGWGVFVDCCLAIIHDKMYGIFCNTTYLKRLQYLGIQQRYNVTLLQF